MLVVAWFVSELPAMISVCVNQAQGRRLNRCSCIGQHGHCRSYTAYLIVTILHTDLFHTYLFISPKTVVAVLSDSVTGVNFLF